MKIFSLVFEMDTFTTPNTNILTGHNDVTYYSISVNGQEGNNIERAQGIFQIRDAIYIESPVVWSLIDFFSTVGLMQEEEKIFGGTTEAIKYPYLLWDTYKQLISPTKILSDSQTEYEQQYKKLQELIQKVIGGNSMNMVKALREYTKHDTQMVRF